MRTILLTPDKVLQFALSTALQKHCPQVEMAAVHTSMAEGLAAIRHQRPDLVFADAGWEGQSVLTSLAPFCPLEIDAVLIANDRQNILEALRMGALDYLTKPLQTEQLLAAVARAEQRRRQRELLAHTQGLFSSLQAAQPVRRPKRIALPQSHHAIEYVPLRQIVRVEAEKSYSYFCLADYRKVLVAKPLGECEEMIGGHPFLRVHRSHLVNLEHVRCFHRQDERLETSDGHRAPVARSMKETLLGRLLEI